MKTDDIKRLAKTHGGFDAIPLDDEEYVSYLEGDVVASQAVYEALKEEAEKDPYIAREHRVAAIMGRMSLNGFRVDEELVHRKYQEGQDRLNAIKKRLHDVHGFPNEGAAPQRSTAGKTAFYEALRASGLGPQWIDANWPKNKDGTLSLGKEVLIEKAELLREPKPAAAEICDAILEMNGVRSIYGNCIDWTFNGRVHPEISPEQSSGRWSVTKPGLTVVGKRGGKVHERSVYLADPGEVLLCFDADQIDMRMIAAHSGDKEYAKLFLPLSDGSLPDAHQMTADLFGMTRDAVKPCNHGANYGIGVNGLVRNGVPREIAEKFLRQAAEQFPAREMWMREVRSIGESGVLLDNGFGRKMRCDPERAYTQAPALIGQGATRDIMAQALLNLPTELRPMLRSVIHDEIVMSVPEDSVEDVRRTVIEAVTMEFKGIPITWGSSKPGRNWAACY
jgi:DNA polymerase-1